MDAFDVPGKTTPRQAKDEAGDGDVDVRGDRESGECRGRRKRSRTLRNRGCRRLCCARTAMNRIRSLLAMEGAAPTVDCERGPHGGGRPIPPFSGEPPALRNPICRRGCFRIAERSHGDGIGGVGSGWAARPDAGQLGKENVRGRELEADAAFELRKSGVQIGAQLRCATQIGTRYEDV